MARRKVGRTRERLSKLLELHGILVAPEDLWMQEGAYRHHTWDLARWGSMLCKLKDGKVLAWYDLDDKIREFHYAHQVIIYSWSRMADCLKKGIYISHDSRDLSSTFNVEAVG